MIIILFYLVKFEARIVQNFIKQYISFLFTNSVLPSYIVCSAVLGRGMMENMKIITENLAVLFILQYLKKKYADFAL